MPYHDQVLCEQLELRFISVNIFINGHRRGTPSPLRITGVYLNTAIADYLLSIGPSFSFILSAVESRDIDNRTVESIEREEVTCPALRNPSCTELAKHTQLQVRTEMRTLPAL